MNYSHEDLARIARFESGSRFSREIYSNSIPISASAQSKWARTPRYDAVQAAKAHILGQLRLGGVPTSKASELLRQIAEAPIAVAIDAFLAGESDTCAIAIPFGCAEAGVLSDAVPITDLLKLGASLALIDLKEVQ